MVTRNTSKNIPNKPNHPTSRSRSTSSRSSRVANAPSNNTSHSSPLSSTPFALSRTKIVTSILVLAFLGFLDATYLTMLGFTRQIPPCSATHGCEKVLTSEYAYIGPVPIAALGVGYFILVMILSILLLQNYKKRTLQVLMGLTTSAFITGVGLIGIQAFILKAFCQYCLAAEAIMSIVFLFTLWLYLGKKDFNTYQS